MHIKFSTGRSITNDNGFRSSGVKTCCPIIYICKTFGRKTITPDYYDLLLDAIGGDGALKIPSFYFHGMQVLQQASLPVSRMGQLIMASSAWDNLVRAAEGRAGQANKQLSRVESNGGSWKFPTRGRAKWVGTQAGGQSRMVMAGGFPFSHTCHCCCTKIQAIQSSRYEAAAAVFRRSVGGTARRWQREGTSHFHTLNHRRLFSSSSSGRCENGTLPNLQHLSPTYPAHYH